MISIFSEMHELYPGMINKNLFELFLVDDEFDGVGFISIFRFQFIPEKESEYRMSYISSCLSPVTRDIVKLKEWFLDEPCETHFYTTEIFREGVTVEDLKQGRGV